MIETVYKILTNAEWADFQSAGSFEGSPVDLEDGYLHFSAADQVAETAEKHFSGQQGLWLVAVQADPKIPIGSGKNQGTVRCSLTFMKVWRSTTSCLPPRLQPAPTADLSLNPFSRQAMDGR